MSVVRNRAVTTAVALLSATSLACATTSQPPPETPTASTPSDDETPGPSHASPARVADRDLVRVIVRQLDADPLVARERIRVVSDGGIVTLEGVVDAPLARHRAVAALHVVRGVRAVVDRLTVAAPLPHASDGMLALAAAAALARDPAVPTQERIAARTRDGMVRLTGTVESDAARRIVEDDLAALPGVRDVRDDLAVDPRPQTDRALVRQIERILGDDPWIDRSDVHVAVSHGFAHLTGSVRSAAERARAESDARVASPLGLDASGLRITDAPDDGTLRSDPPATRPDGEIRQGLADACASDPRIRPFVPEIDVRNGVVVLTGVAPSAEAARAAADDAIDIPGAVSVRDALRTTPAASATNAAVESAVLDAIRSDPTLGPTSLWVEAVSGRVILRGVVPSDGARVKALALASSADGVADVEDALLVELPRPAHAQREATKVAAPFAIAKRGN
jgi:osmotically-inducible protein OsmY